MSADKMKYETPRLSKLGTLSNLTLGVTGSIPDGASQTAGHHEGGPQF